MITNELNKHKLAIMGQAGLQTMIDLSQSNIFKSPAQRRQKNTEGSVMGATQKNATTSGLRSRHMSVALTPAPLSTLVSQDGRQQGQSQCENRQQLQQIARQITLVSPVKNRLPKIGMSNQSEIIFPQIASNTRGSNTKGRHSRVNIEDYVRTIKNAIPPDTRLDSQMMLPQGERGKEVYFLEDTGSESDLQETSNGRRSGLSKQTGRQSPVSELETVISLRQQQQQVQQRIKRMEQDAGTKIVNSVEEQDVDKVDWQQRLDQRLIMVEHERIRKREEQKAQEKELIEAIRDEVKQKDQSEHEELQSVTPSHLNNKTQQPTETSNELLLPAIKGITEAVLKPVNKQDLCTPNKNQGLPKGPMTHKLPWNKYNSKRLQPSCNIDQALSPKGILKKQKNQLASPLSLHQAISESDSEEKINETETSSNIEQQSDFDMALKKLNQQKRKEKKSTFAKKVTIDPSSTLLSDAKKSASNDQQSPFKKASTTVEQPAKGLKSLKTKFGSSLLKKTQVQPHMMSPQERVRMMKWDEGEEKLQLQLKINSAKIKAQQDDDTKSVQSMFSEHLSVFEEKMDKKQSIRRPNFARIQTQAADSVPEETDQDYEEESEGSDNSAKRQARERAAAEMQNANSNAQRDAFKRELAQQKSENEYELKMCGPEFLEKLQDELEACVKGSKKLKKAKKTKKKQFTDIQSVTEESENFSSDFEESKDRHMRESREIKAKQNEQKMLKSGNTSLFKAEQNKNYFSDKKSKAAQKFVRAGKQQAAFNKLCKNYVDICQTPEGQADPRLKFFEECIKDMQLPIPLLQKIIDGSLTLKNYVLNQGTCKAISQFLEMNPFGLTRLYLKQNSVGAEQINTMLQGLTKQQGFRSLAIHENEFDASCATAVGNLLKKKPNEQLEDLRLSHCRINWKTTHQLLTTLSTQRCFLRKLQLVKANLNEFSTEVLGDVLRFARSISHLDISWNAMSPNTMSPLVEILSKNRRLQYLNLAWNGLVDINETEEKQKELLMQLARLIKFNSKFLHFDLTGTGLTRFMIFHIGKQLKRSRSLLAIHLGANPGLTQETIAYLRDRISARPNEDIERFVRIQQHVKQANPSKKGQFIDGLYAKQTKIVEQKAEVFEPIGASGGAGDRFVLQRMLGHKALQPGSGQWYESSNASIPNAQHYKHQCWICEGHVYGVIFWSRKDAFRLKPLFTSTSGDGKEAMSIAEQIDRETPYSKATGLISKIIKWVKNEKRIQEEEEYEIKAQKAMDSDDIKPLRELTTDDGVLKEVELGDLGAGLGHVKGNVLYEELDDRVPYVAGSFTGWRYQKMRRVFDICTEMDAREYQEPFQRCRDRGDIKAETYQQCSRKEQKLFHKVKLAEAIRYTYEWQHWLQQFLTYKKPFIVNGYEMKEWFDEDMEVRDMQFDSAIQNDLILNEVENNLNDDLSSDELERKKERKDRAVIRKKKRRDKLARKKDRVVRREDGEVDLSTSESDVDSLQVERDDELIAEAMELYALPVFLKPGKQQYMVKLRDSTQPAQRNAQKQKMRNERLGQDHHDKIEIEKALQPELFFYETQATRREEEIPEFAKELLSRQEVRKYNRGRTCFRHWIPDDPKKFPEMAALDFQYWKVGQKMIKDDTDRENVQKLIAKHYGMLKKIFIYLSSKSAYPALGSMDYSHFVQKSKIPDKNVNIASVDRAFIATNVQPRGAPEVPNNPGNALCRYQFMEIVVRLSTEKYKGPGYVQTFAEALERLLTECIIPNFLPSVEPWQEWRDEILWTMDVTDCMEVNEENMKVIYNSFFTQIKKWVELPDCQKLAIDCNLNLNEKDVTFAFGMSKMSIGDEVLQKGNSYQCMKFVEFIEFFARLADKKYKTNDPLATKIENLMDDIFPHFGIQRKDVEVEIAEISESDNDY